MRRLPDPLFKRGAQDVIPENCPPELCRGHMPPVQGAIRLTSGHKCTQPHPLAHSRRLLSVGGFLLVTPRPNARTFRDRGGARLQLAALYVKVQPRPPAERYHALGLSEWRR